jgi:flagellar motor switch protein FliN/FliY
MPSDSVTAIYKQLVLTAADVIYTLAVQKKPKIEFGNAVETDSIALSGRLAEDLSFSAKFSGIPAGKVIVTIPVDLALHLAGSMMGTGKPEKFDSAEKSAIFELMNNITVNWAGYLSEKLSIEIDVSDQEIFDPGSLSTGSIEKWFEVSSSVTVGEKNYTLSVFLPLEMTKHMEENLEKETGSEQISETPDAGKPVTGSAKKASSEPVAEISAPVTGTEKTHATESEESHEHDTHKVTKPDEGVNIRQSQFQQLQQEPDESLGQKTEISIDLILDVPLLVSVELGRKDLTIKEILELSPGSLIELNQLAGEPVDLLINGRLFARGEVVVIDENFGIRVTHIISPRERVEKLR